MQTIKILIVITCCLILAACVPVTGGKGLLSIILPLCAAFVSAVQWIYSRCEDRVRQKANQLDTFVTNHEAQYHVPMRLKKLGTLSEN